MFEDRFIGINHELDPRTRTPYDQLLVGSTYICRPGREFKCMRSVKEKLCDEDAKERADLCLSLKHTLP
jgi:hypothetical protein